MRKYIINLLFLSPLFAVGQHNVSFELEGRNVKDTKKVYILHYSFDDNTQVVDSAMVRNGRFSLKKEFTGTAYTGILFRERFEAQQRNPKDFWFYLSPGKTVVDFSSKPKVIDGGEQTQTYMEYVKDMEASKAVFSSTAYLSEKAKADSLTAEAEKRQIELLTKFGTPQEGSINTKIQFIKDNPNNQLSVLFLESLAGGKPDVAMIKPLLAGLSAELKATNRMKRLQGLLKGMELVVGAKAVDFEQPDVNGNPVSLSDFKGKYLLVDFWASWCVPCRQENPNLVAAYHKYKSKNLEILGVSLDNKKESWERAIMADNLTWIQVSDLKGWANEAAEIYAIRAVPSNILIDPNGIIIAKNLRGEALDAALSKLIK